MNYKKDFLFISEDRCKEIQLELRNKVELKDDFKIEDIKYVAGIDLAYWMENKKETAVCCITVIDMNTREIIEEKNTKGDIVFPYIAGYLSFRELSLILETVEKLSIKADLYVFDGNGYLHPRNMGIATHASFYLNKPSIGVAKSYYKIDETEFIMPEDIKGAYTKIVIENKVYGAALRTHKGVKPIFVSVGNHIKLETAIEIIMMLIGKESHIPLPTRYADIATHKMRDFYKNNR
ncbi:endonuclease V [Fusobacterium varium]|uniref:endonuclease V n=1 Tax=Fusobacterium varium TaxID=856 RepID=UPI000BBAC3C4|nr:endonuclease V [Fusobacterium varium]